MGGRQWNNRGRHRRVVVAVAPLQTCTGALFCPPEHTCMATIDEGKKEGPRLPDE